MSLNQWIATAVAQKIDVVETAAEFFTKRKGRATGVGLLKFVRSRPNLEPEAEDGSAKFLTSRARPLSSRTCGSGAVSVLIESVAPIAYVEGERTFRAHVANVLDIVRGIADRVVLLPVSVTRSAKAIR